MKRIIILSLIMLPVLAQAQADVFSNNGYMGVTFSKHDFRNGMKRVGDWQGIEFTTGKFVFGFSQGSLRHENADSTIGSPSGKMFSMGARVGWDLNLGGNSFFSVGAKPFIDFAGVSSQVTNIIANTKTSSIGFKVSPGIQLRFSHLYLIAKYDAGLHLNTVFWGGNGKYNAVKGYLGGLNFTIGIENGFDLLIPNLYSFRGLKMKVKQYENSEYGYNKRGDYIKTTIKTTVTSYTPGEVLLSAINPFWGVGPSYSFYPRYKRHAPTEMKGINAGVRFNYWMLDGFYEEGAMGLDGLVGRDEIIVNYPRLRDYSFSSQIEAKNYGGRIGFNLSKLLKFAYFKMDKKTGKTAAMKVPFTRISAFYTMGVTEFKSKPTFTYEGANALLTDYQTKKSITPDATNNANYLPEKTTFTGWGMSLEFGSAFFNYTKLKYKDAKIADHNQMTIGANIPLGRVINSVRASYLIGKINRKKKKIN